MLDSLNPLSWIRVARDLADFAPEFVIMPWWTVYWSFCFNTITSFLARRGVPVVYYCHNVFDHESSYWKRGLASWVLRKGDRYFVHTEQDRRNLLAIIPDASVCVHPHPIYNQFPPPDGRIPHRRARVELLFFGFVRPYKGLDTLLSALALLKGSKSIRLTVAGEFWKGEKQTLEEIKRLGLEDIVDIDPGYHSDQETANIFSRADYVVLPYKNASGSGVVPIAYHYGKPVVVTRVGGLPDVVQHGRTGFIVAPDDPQALASQLRELLNIDPSRFRPHIERMKKRMSWGSLANLLLSGDDCV